MQLMQDYMLHTIDIFITFNVLSFHLHFVQNKSSSSFTRLKLTFSLCPDFLYFSFDDFTSFYKINSE